MERVISLSLGSSAGDFSYEIRLPHKERMLVERRGVSKQDFSQALRIILREKKHAAIGLGGLITHLYTPGSSTSLGISLREAEELLTLAGAWPLIEAELPITDGHSYKNAAITWIINEMIRMGHLTEQSKVLVLSGVDWSATTGLATNGYTVTFADLFTGVGIPVPLNLKRLQFLAHWLIPGIAQLPLDALYPTGKQQIAPRQKQWRGYEGHTVFFGDGHLLARVPDNYLRGATVCTNTIRPDQLTRLANAGVHILWTLGGSMGERYPGSNLRGAIGWAGGERNRKGTLTCRQNLGYGPEWKRLR